MGCDIHLFTEVKINGQWHCYGHPNVPRCYPLFALMADVRNEDGEVHPIAKPKGLPDDCSQPVRLSAAYWKRGGHSFSWLSAQELAKLDEAWPAIRDTHMPNNGWRGSDLEHHYFGYLEGNGWGGFYRYPGDRKPWIGDVRFVFWFDN